LSQEEKWAEYERASHEVLVDFDGTICQFNYPELGEPLPGARHFMRALMARGLRPIIWSSRMSPEIYTYEERCEAAEAIAAWAAQHKIPYYAIDTGENGKRLCMAYVDDRGVHANGNFDAMLHRIDQIVEKVEGQHRRTRRGNAMGNRH
jgi:hypothetical protein